MSEYELFVTVEYEDVGIDTSSEAQTAVLAVANIVDWGSLATPVPQTKTILDQCDW